MTIDRKPFPSAAAAIALLGIALYAVNLGGTYVYDDIPVVQFDGRLHPQVDWRYIWTRGYNKGVDRLYRPLVTSSYALEWLIHGDRPWAFHLVNILLFAACSVCVGEMARRMLGSRIGLAAGLLFAAHPLHVEAVSYIVGRAELLCGLGFFAALLLALKPITLPRALAISGCFVVSILSKEQGILLPLIILTLLLIRRWENPAEPIGTRDSLLSLAALLLVLLSGYLIWREEEFRFYWNRNDLDWTINPLTHSAALQRWLVPIEILGRYVALFFAPVALSPDYGANVIEPFIHFRQPYFYIGILALIAWCALLVVALKKRRPILLFLLLALAITYGLVGNMVMLIGTSMGERLIYMPSAFLIILFGWGLSRAIPNRIPYILVLAVLLGMTSLRTVTYAAKWNDAVELFESAVRAQPDSVHLHMLLADELRQRGQFEQAQTQNWEAVKLQPNYWYAWFQCGQVAAEQGQFDQAQDYFRKSMQLQPNPNANAWLAEELPKRRAATRSAATSGP